MGADFYDTFGEEVVGNSSAVKIGVGDGTQVKDAIIDKNAHIGREVSLSPKGMKDGWADEEQNIYVRDGIIVVIKNAIVSDGTKIGIV